MQPGNKLKKKTLKQLDWVEITFASQRTFAFCSTGMNWTFVPVALYADIDILYIILDFADQWWQKQGGEKSIDSHIQNSHATLIFKRRESPKKNGERRNAKEPLLISTTTVRYVLQGSGLKGELPLCTLCIPLSLTPLFQDALRMKYVYLQNRKHLFLENYLLPKLYEPETKLCFQKE